ncbi:pilus assembly protein [Parvibaculum sp.]|jgi:Flp pilus assembly protein TadG|nr:pilus assembly protein [Parvibaculum sp.]MBO6677851.1 pilus assembly protein [Parvibaculum sp.]MBO6685468.1 pilus assembly protein [Parvibaculum sp.]MBO6903832.1 pilus assembly protein [Parvibaculum sp.]
MRESKVERRWTLRGFRRSRSGATAIEFSLLAMPFFALLFALIETSVIYFSNANLDSVVADAGRLIRTGQVQSGGMTEAQFKSYICDRLTLVSDCASDVHVDVRKFSSFGSVTPPALIDGDGNIVETTVFQPGSAGDIVLVRVYFSWGIVGPSIVGLSNLEGGGHLVAASAAFRNEPFGTFLPAG